MLSFWCFLAVERLSRYSLNFKSIFLSKCIQRRLVPSSTFAIFMNICTYSIHKILLIARFILSAKVFIFRFKQRFCVIFWRRKILFDSSNAPTPNQNEKRISDLNSFVFYVGKMKWFCIFEDYYKRKVHQHLKSAQRTIHQQIYWMQTQLSNFIFFWG